jgi:hypothetical protein
MGINANNAVVSIKIENGVVLVGSDAHIWPGPLSTMQRGFLQFAKMMQPYAIVANGDFCDFPQISRFQSIGWEKKPTVADELAAVRDYMGSLAQAAPSAKRVWPLGNHDMRFETLIAAKAPEMANIHGVHLKDHFPQWQPCWRIDVNSDVVIRHRELGGEHADYRNVVSQGKTIITGHDHRTGVVPYRNYAGLHWGVRCGFLGDSADDPQYINYLECRQPNWIPAFVVLTFKNGRLLWPELATKFDDDHLEFRGEVVKV